LLADQIEQLGYLEQLIDHDGNPSTSKVTRGEAYLSMYVKSRDYLIPRGHAPNQFGVNAYAAYLANEAIKLLDPGQAWPQDRMLEHLYIAVGLRTDRYGGSWISPKGLSLEPNGSSRGGYCGNYGPHAIELLANLARVTGDEIIAGRARDVVESFQYFQYPAVDARGFHTFRTEGVITWRNNKLPGANGYEISPYMALELEVPAAIRLIQLYLEHNRIYEVDLNWQNVHYLSYVTRAIDLLQDLDALRALPLTDYRLPMERDGDVVFTDEMAGAIALKHNDVRMYVSLNWRHGFRGNERAYGNARPNNIARIHYTTDAVERIANVQMNSPYGFMQLYELDYGEYLIRMNCSQTETYPLTVSEQFTQALDLVTGDVLDLTKEYSIPPQTTLVLYTGTHAAANPVFELQDQLQDPDPIVRRDAVIELGKYGVETAEVLPDLMGLLSDEAAHVRIEVARTLGLIGEAGLPGLIAACEDLHPLVRQTAINSLGNLGVVNSAVKTVLNKGLQDEDAGVRQAAVKAVEKVNLQDENTLVNLGILIGDRELAVALNARTALQNMGVLTETMTVLVESLAESDRRVEIVNALGRLGGYGQQFVPIALDMINSESTEIRYAAVVALESLGSHSLEALPELIGCLEDESSIVKRAALNSLESLGVFAVPDPDLLTVISGLLYDHDRAIKWETARILFNYGFEFAAANPAVLAEMGAIFDGLDLELIHQHLPDLQLAALPRNIPANLVTVKPGEDIQAAIDQLASQGGGTVQLAPGVYEIASPILLRSKIRLSGSGLDTVIIPGSGAEVQFLVYGAGGLIDVIIEDLMLDGGKNRQERQWTWQVDSHTAQPNGLFILDDNGRQNERILISNVAITRTAMGLHSKGTNDLIITDVKAYDNGGVYSYFHNAYLRRNERVLITNSLFADSHTGNGLNLTLQDSVVVYNNLFINNVFRGVRAANSRNLVICRNVASQNKDFGMGTRSEDGGVTDYMIFNNYASLNGVNYSIHSAANGFYDNNISLR
ncbi:MAG TPA: hypothetical protein GX739_00565, partial [Firmicutes bacterium]|nr:hypothetical protein [Bacillota bacterium]